MVEGIIRIPKLLSFNFANKCFRKRQSLAIVNPSPNPVFFLAQRVKLFDKEESCVLVLYLHLKGK